MRRQRIARLKTAMTDQGLDCMALIPGTSLFYFTGLSVLLHERPMILLVNARGPNTLLLPGLEQPSASALLPAEEYTYYPYSDADGYTGALAALAADLGLNNCKIGMEFQGMRFFEFDLLRKSAPDAEFVNGEPLVEALRMIKDAQEIAFLRRASEITDRALDETLKVIRPGVSELEVLNEMIVQLLRAGSREPLKYQIVVSGPRSAFPHAKASERRIAPGDIVMIDTGATFNGYPCDLTRTFAVGEIDAEMRKIYEIVRQANAAVINCTAAPLTAGALDKAARDVIEDAGYGKYFIHRTGHGLGIGGHEALSIAKGSELVLQPGMTFTDEPGIYIPGKGGVRIEDNVVVTEKGLEYLTAYPRELRVL